MIADVLLKNQQYITVDERGKEIAREFESRLGTLMDFSDTFLIFKRNDQYYSYDENFKELAREFDSRLGICRKVVGAVTTFKKIIRFILTIASLKKLVDVSCNFNSL